MRRSSRFHPRVMFSRLKTKLPFFVWLLAIAAVAALVMIGGSGGMLPGMVEKTDMVVGSTQTGILKELHVVPGQTIQAGQVVARIDDQELRDRQAKLSLDLKLEALKVGQTFTEFAFDARTKRDEKTIELRKAQSEIAAIDEQLAKLTPLVSAGLLEPQATTSLASRRETLAKTIDLYPVTFQNLDQQILWANDQKQRQTKAILSPGEFFEDLNIVTEADLLKRQIENCEVRTPSGGIVSIVNIPQGQYIQAGQPLFTMVLTNNNMLVAFLDQNSQYQPEIGQEWLVRSGNTRHDDGYYRARVASLAPDIVALEAKLSMLPTKTPRGRFIRLKLLEPAPFLPGQSVMLVTKRPPWHGVSKWLRERIQGGSASESIAVLP